VVLSATLLLEFISWPMDVLVIEPVDVVTSLSHERFMFTSIRRERVSDTVSS